jgi:LCP family protein required for cell wall assembly
METQSVEPRKSLQQQTIFGLVIASFIVILAAGIGSFMFVRDYTLRRNGPGLEGPQINSAISANAVTPLAGNTATDRPTAAQDTPPPSPTLLPWDGAGRVTILMLGVDYRDWEEQKDYSRSDTMMLLTLDPLTMRAGILSIPRDLWVAIPGFKHGKINTAYYLGQAYKLPGGGPGLAIKTVEQFIGVPVNYYAQIDFDAFVRFIDEIGGVKIDVPEKITIDLLGGGGKTKKTLQPGIQVLPGEWALAYARARHTEGGDFDRARRQQQVLMGIRDRILSRDMLPILIQKAPVLFNELSSSIHTNLDLQDMIKLALLAKDIPEASIQRAIIGKESTLFGFSPDDLSILIPIADKIHLLRDQIFAADGSLSPATPGSPQERMKAESARLEVLNGSQAPELGTLTVNYLLDLGANIVNNGDADQTYPATTIIDYTGNPHTLTYLVDLLGIRPGRILSRYNPGSPIDVQLILGSDWAASNPFGN